MPNHLGRLLIAALAASLFASRACAEDGYDLWLRYRPLPASTRVAEHRQVESVTALGSDSHVRAAASELERAITGLLGGARPGVGSGGEVVLATSDSSVVRRMHLDPSGLGAQGYLVRSFRVAGRSKIIVTANSGVGVLYGTFALIREMQLGRSLDQLNLRSTPRYALRMLDHWDNLDGTVERGYAGRSLWEWQQLPAVSRRMIDYARADASVGINGVVLNNVNADARVLTAPYLRKVAALADAWRPYGIRIFLSARFSAPIDVGGLETADPLDPQVRAWWSIKADEIYRLIPDFGGFLVKASSEGQPGPQTYGRSHADGANMLAAALAPHGGTLIWRAFVYSRANAGDRARQAYDEFAPLDGKFAPNVIIQVKNGPIDFQPREPFHPLFGAMPRTHLAMEVQLTKEYLGESTHLAFLGTMWSEALRSRTARPRPGSEVLDTIDAMAGVANVGSNRNWTGSNFDQANWYAFGRLAWDPAADPRTIADEWTRMTWGSDPRVVRTIVPMMMRSREAVVDYMTPLGLAHQMASDHHYGPGPWVHDQPAALWNPTYYNRADAHGIGFDRTSSGSDAVAQYAPEVGGCFARLDCVADDELLWFHHVPWTYRMRSGQSLWDELISRYDDGVATVQGMIGAWAAIRPLIDPERHTAVAGKLQRQLVEARWWRDASIAYWQSLSKMPLPKGHPAPLHPLAWYEAIHFGTVPGFLSPRIGSSGSCVVTKGGPPCAP